MGYIYCLVKPVDISKEYFYLSDVPDIRVGDYVEIPFGYDNSIENGRVMKVMLCEDEESCPFPPEKTKRIIRKVVLEESGKGYKWCRVKPITHKNKTFEYISNIDVEVGDYVDIPFGQYRETRIAEVMEVSECSTARASEFIFENKKVIRKLTEENSDYVRFMKRNGFSHVINTKPGKYDHVDAPADEKQYKVRGLGDVSALIDHMRDLSQVSVSDKLALLRSLDGCFAQWGADYHKYIVEKPVTRQEVDNFEKAYEVTLPQEYIEFVTEVGNGGAGIAKLDVWDYHMSLNYLKYDFPLGEYGEIVYVDRLKGQLGYECNEEGECETCLNSSQCPASCYVDDYEKIDARYLLGTLPLSYQGCTYTERLIVTGPRAGSVWMENEGVCMSCIADSFYDYINSKLDRQLWPIKEALKLMEAKTPAEEIRNFDFNKYGYIDKALMFCGILEINVRESERKSEQVLWRRVEAGLEALYNPTAYSTITVR